MWKISVHWDRPQTTLWRMRIARWTPKSTNTHSEYAILTAFALQQWLHKLASVLRYTYIACLVNNKYSTHGSSLYFVVCVLSAVQLHDTQYTHHNLKHMLPQHCIIYNDISLLIISTKV